MKRMAGLGLVMLALSVGCGSKGSGTPDAGGDPRCSLANCQALIDTCRLEPLGAPTNLSTCAALPDGGQLDLTSQVLSYCQKACLDDGDGALLECVANQASLCGDGGSAGQDAVSAACASSDAGTPSQACLDQCDQAEQGCYAACPASDADSCLSCGYQCSQQYRTCVLHC